MEKKDVLLQNTKMMQNELPTIHQSPTQIFGRFLKFGFLAWGGPVAQIAMIKRELVEEEKWITVEKFNRVLAVYQALPGPEAHELCVYFGMLAGGRRGGFLAGLGFMLPGLVLMLLLTGFYVTFGVQSALILAVFAGFQSAVVALIVTAVHRIGKHILVNVPLATIAVIAAVAFFLGAHFLFILPTAGVAYFFWVRGNTVMAVLPVVFLLLYAGYSFVPDISPALTSAETMAPGFHQGSIFQIFFSGLKGGLLTFGGAYTAIPFMQQDAVLEQAWMTQQQFLDGIALSGILPAPMIIFTTFVGYFGGGWPGAVAITLGIFLPAFSFTLIGHQLMERLIAHKTLHDFLDGLSAGAIGLMATTAVLLLRETLQDGRSLAICMAAFLVLHYFKSKFTVIYVVTGSGLLALLFRNG